MALPPPLPRDRAALVVLDVQERLFPATEVDHREFRELARLIR